MESAESLLMADFDIEFKKHEEIWKELGCKLIEAKGELESKLEEMKKELESKLIETRGELESKLKEIELI